MEVSELLRQCLKDSKERIEEIQGQIWEYERSISDRKKWIADEENNVKKFSEALEKLKND